jgi:hypothetical protein
MMYDTVWVIESGKMPENLFTVARTMMKDFIGRGVNLNLLPFSHFNQEIKVWGLLEFMNSNISFNES